MNRPPKAIIVNLFAGPGAGKSTLSALAFAKLKMKGIDVELVTEFAKDKTWEKNFTALGNQPYIFGKQNFRLARVASQVDVAITDSPIILSNYYVDYFSNNDPLYDNFKKSCLDIFNSYHNLNFFIRRVKPYNPNGRSQTEQEADEISKAIDKILQENGIHCMWVPGNEEGCDIIVEKILQELHKIPVTFS